MISVPDRSKNMEITGFYSNSSYELPIADVVRRVIFSFTRELDYCYRMLQSVRRNRVVSRLNPAQTTSNVDLHTEATV